ncbi:hypothetical protein, partial [Chromobacterium sp. LK1]|uniref:hypothetical protein n=1 Tax=Chromobacterium sp. LK1 TaxID=1628193 RepID=UPI001E41ED23
MLVKQAHSLSFNVTVTVFARYLRWRSAPLIAWGLGGRPRFLLVALGTGSVLPSISILPYMKSRDGVETELKMLM